MKAQRTECFQRRWTSGPQDAQTAQAPPSWRGFQVAELASLLPVKITWSGNGCVRRSRDPGTCIFHKTFQLSKCMLFCSWVGDTSSNDTAEKCTQGVGGVGLGSGTPRSCDLSAITLQPCLYCESKLLIHALTQRLVLQEYRRQHEMKA